MPSCWAFKCLLNKIETYGHNVRIYIKGGLKMNDHRLLSALSYFSIFFAPFLLPLIIFFASSNELVKKHTKRAMLSHIIPVVAGIIVFIIFIIITNVRSLDNVSGDSIFFIWIIVMIIYAIVSLGITIWNVVQGIRVLQ